MPNIILDPTAAKLAIDAGTWSIDRIQSAPSTYLYLDVSGAAWVTTSDTTKTKIRKVNFDRIKAGSVNVDGSIVVAEGVRKLVEDDGYARLVPLSA